MKREEIEKAVAVTANKLLFARTVQPDSIEAETEKALFDLACSLVLRAYEEAMKTQCAMCRDELPVKRSAWSNYMHVVQTVKPEPPFFPYEVGDACTAASIRALASSLEEEK